jgi:hypothetical protein
MFKQINNILWWNKCQRKKSFDEKCEIHIISVTLRESFRLQFPPAAKMIMSSLLKRMKGLLFCVRAILSADILST